jgi:Tol biopolymer transport system component
MAVPFDLDKLEVTGGSVPMVEDVYRESSQTAPQYAVSNSGTLVYAQKPKAEAALSQRTLVWADRNGKEEPLGAPLNLYRFPKISPDGTRVAMTFISEGGSNGDFWVWDLARKTLSRLAFEGALKLAPVWTPDGKRIAFFQPGVIAADIPGIYWKAADGSGKTEQLGSSPNRFFLPYSWSGDRKTLVGAAIVSGLKFDIEMLSMEGDHALKPLLCESYMENQPKISPDGRWMAYTSNESRKNEVYVRPFPEVNNGR